MMIFEKLFFVLLVYVLTAVDVYRHTEIQKRGQSPSHILAAIARGIVGAVLLGVFCFWLDLFVWYWTVAFAFVNVWFTFNWWRNEVMGHKWYYLGIDSDPEEDSIIDKLLKHMLPEEVSMTFLAFASAITLLLFVLYGHMTWEEVLRYREFGI